MGVPFSSSILIGFSIRNYPAIGIPHGHGNPHMSSVPEVQGRPLSVMKVLLQPRKGQGKAKTKLVLPEILSVTHISIILKKKNQKSIKKSH